MICGFDYGTSNCAMSVMSENGARLLPLEENNAFLPSTLYALDRDLITESVGHNMLDEAQRQAFLHDRQAALLRAQRVRREEDIRQDDQVLFLAEKPLLNIMIFQKRAILLNRQSLF